MGLGVLDVGFALRIPVLEIWGKQFWVAGVGLPPFIFEGLGLDSTYSGQFGYTGFPVVSFCAYVFWRLLIKLCQRRIVQETALLSSRGYFSSVAQGAVAT